SAWPSRSAAGCGTPRPRTSTSAICTVWRCRTWAWRCSCARSATRRSRCCGGRAGGARRCGRRTPGGCPSATGWAWPRPTLASLGELLRQQGRADEARALTVRAAEISQDLLAAQPNNPDVLLNLANAMGGLGRWDEAERLADEVLALAPGHPQAQFIKFAVG